MGSASVRHEHLVVPDGTSLAVQDVGAGPLVLVANGLGGSLRAWAPFLTRFGAGHRVVSFDYRGLYQSSAPADSTGVTIEDHARDLLAVHRWAGGEPALVIGWSMGVQVAVEAALAEPDLMTGLVLVAGAAGDPLAGVLHTPLSKVLVPPATRVVEAGAPLFGGALRLLAASRSGPGVLRRLGVVAPTCDLDTFHALAGEFARLDWRVYMRTVRSMAEHDARPRLGEVTVPTLVVGGTRDLFLPERELRATSAALADSELLVIDGATHYLPLEFPEVLDRRVRRFEAQRVGSSGAATL
jgi:pimeloyl-ACP methyl ester carboxylesterase